MIAYVLPFVRTNLLLVIFKRSIQVRKLLTAKKKNSNSAKETKLMRNVLSFVSSIFLLVVLGLLRRRLKALSLLKYILLEAEVCIKTIYKSHHMLNMFSLLSKP